MAVGLCECVCVCVVCVCVCVECVFELLFCSVKQLCITFISRQHRNHKLLHEESTATSTVFSRELGMMEKGSSPFTFLTARWVLLVHRTSLLCAASSKL